MAVLMRVVMRMPVLIRGGSVRRVVDVRGRQGHSGRGLGAADAAVVGAGGHRAILSSTTDSLGPLRGSPGARLTGPREWLSRRPSRRRDEADEFVRDVRLFEEGHLVLGQVQLQGAHRVVDA